MTSANSNTSNLIVPYRNCMLINLREHATANDLERSINSVTTITTDFDDAVYYVRSEGIGVYVLYYHLYDI